jgi:hypothetical protein
MTRTVAFLFYIVFPIFISAAPIKPGTYSLATEAGWTAWFELNANSTARISPAYSTEDFDPEVAKIPKPTPLKGTWKKTAKGIEIKYGKVTDTFDFESTCKDWEEHPCFKFVSSKTSGDEKTVLEYRHPYVNWNVKSNSPKKHN